MTGSPSCIYCKSQEGPFNREHVIPEAFGKFKQNLVLHDCVCAACNSYFSRELELNLARDSAEALLRLRYGLKPVAEARELRDERVQMRVREHGPWYGARFIRAPSDTGTELQTEVLSQIGFRKKPDGEWVWFTERELRNPAVVEPYRSNVEIKIAGPSDEALERMRGKLRELGIDFQQQGVLDQPVAGGESIRAELEYRIDEVIFRGIAKIALNYVAHVRDQTFVLRPDFDAIRRFVRYGENPGWPPVWATQIPILADDTRRWRQTSGHLVVFDWNRGKEGLVVLVSLFNNITYHVLICRKYQGLWHPLESGHHFALDSRTISPVTPTNLVRPLTRW